MVMNGWTKSDIWKISFLRDEAEFIWIWIKDRKYKEDHQFTKLKSSNDYKYRFFHGTTPAGNFGISRNSHQDASQGILPQMGSLTNKTHTPLKGLFALGFELHEDADTDWGEMKTVINLFKDHGKNQLGVAWTGTVTGTKCGRKHGAWNAQNVLATTKHNIVTAGGRVYCIRANKAMVDGAFIKISTQPPNDYDPTKPFQLG